MKTCELCRANLGTHAAGVAWVQGLPFALHSLMDAHHPWSGHYNVRSPIWAAAHMNQHTAIGTPHDSLCGHIQTWGVPLVVPE
eukprot:COSAG04_NODE_14207_length_577_cov_0.650628_1_plen_83_part_00